MDILLLLARLVLAAVFAFAGVAKLADLEGSRSAMRAFGLPASLAARAGTVLPVVELVVAAALIPTATARWGAIGALVLLLTFAGAIAANLALGRHPQCHCFGQLSSEPVGWPVLLRNGLLSIAAIFILAAGWDDAGTSVVAWVDDASAITAVALTIGVLALALSVLEGWALVQLLRQNGRLLMRIATLEAATPGTGASTQNTSDAGLPVGTQAPDFVLARITGGTTTLETLREAGKPVLLVFSDTNCGPCNALLPELGTWRQTYDDRLTMAMLSNGPEEANRAKAQEHGLNDIVLQQEPGVADAYGAYGTPAGVVVRPDGTIGSAVALGAEEIRALVLATVAPSPPGAVASVGEPAPAFTLPDLDGNLVKVAGTRERPTLLLFWSPSCGFCSQMLDDLKAWEATRHPRSPELLVISSGDVNSNRALGLRAPILLDQSFGTGFAFGAGGTPSAILIDADGRIASPCAVGATAVLSLARGEALARA